MITPGWILDIFAAVMLVVAAVSAARLVAARPWQPGAIVLDTDIAHLLMGIAMAGTLVASLQTLPSGAWEIVFGVLTVWFGYRVIQDARTSGARSLAGGHCAPHLVHSGAMLYMFLAVAAGGSGMAGMGGSSGSAMPTLKFPFLAFVFALVLVGYSVWDLDLLSGSLAGGHRSLSGARAAFAGSALAGVPALAGAESPAAAFVGPHPAAGGVATAAQLQQAETEPAAPGGGTSWSGLVAAREHLLGPGTTIGCRIAMGVTMAFMLLIMI